MRVIPSVALLLAAGLTAAGEGHAEERPATSQPASQAAGAAEEEVEELDASQVQVRTKVGASGFWTDAYPQIDRGVSLPLPQPVRRGAVVLVVDHRTYKPFTENTWHDYFGFDGGSLKIGLGLRFGVWHGLDAGVYRLNSATERFDVYEFDARYLLLQQARQIIDLGLRGGVTWFSQEDAEDAVGFLGQLLLARRLFNRLTLATGLLFHSESTNGVKASMDDNWSLAAMALVDVRILGWLAWNAEVAVNVAGYGTRDKRDAAGEAVSSWPSFSSSVRFITHRHTFALVLSNNPYTSSDGYVANTPRGFDRLVVGFTITREWNFW